MHHSAALCQRRRVGAKGQKMSSFSGLQFSFLESYNSFFSVPARLFCTAKQLNVLQSHGQNGREEQLEGGRPHWSVFSTPAKSCNHNEVRPWSCCCDLQSPLQRDGGKDGGWQLISPPPHITLSILSFCCNYLHLSLYFFISLPLRSLLYHLIVLSLSKLCWKLFSSLSSWVTTNNLSL